MQIIMFLNRTYRPFLAWTCALSIFCDSLLRFILYFFGVNPPDINISEIIGSVAIILGLGAYRTYEKKTGLTK
jgi:hypothetical protein